jgi:hypothetical protein
MTAPRLFLLVLALAAAAGGLWYAFGALDGTPAQEPALPEQSERSLIRLTPAAVDRLTLHQPRFNLSLRLERDAEGVWRLQDPLQDLAEPVAVFGALSALYSQDWSAAPAEWTTQDLAALGLEPAELAVEVREAGGATQLLRVGATDYSGRWRAAQLDGALIRVGEGLISPLVRDAESWRAHRLQPLSPPAVTHLRWTANDGSVLALARAGESWRVLEPFQAPLDERQAPFVDRMLGARAPVLRRDALTEFPLQGERIGTLELTGAGTTHRLELHADGLAASHRAYGMLWDADDFQILFRDPETLRSPRLLALDPGTIVSLRVQRGADEGVFRRVSAGWSLDGFGALPPEESGFLVALLDHGTRLEGSAWQPLPDAAPTGRVSYSISRTPREDAPTLVWWAAADGTQLVAAQGAERATPTEVNFDRAVAELFTRIAALR